MVRLCAEALKQWCGRVLRLSNSGSVVRCWSQAVEESVEAPFVAAGLAVTPLPVRF